MIRYPDWPERLSAFVAQDAIFEWGVRDCCLWACDGITAMTGTDPGQPLRGLYSDEAQAKAVLRRLGGGGLVETARLLARVHGRDEIAPLQAQRGDAVICEGEGMAALGLCIGRYAAVLTPRGKRHVRLGDAVTAFRV